MIMLNSFSTRLEPLLARIKKDRRVLVTPSVDDIFHNTLEYNRNGGEDGM